MNIMLIGLLFITLIVICVKILRTCKEKIKHTEKEHQIFDQHDGDDTLNFKQYNSFIWNNIFLIYVFFVMYQIFFNAVISTIEESPVQTTFSPGINFVAAVLAFLIVITGILSIGFWYCE